MDKQAFSKLSQTDQIAFLLKQTFHNNDTAQRREAEDLLASLKTSPNKFTELLVSIIISPETNLITKGVNESASNYLNLFIKTHKYGNDSESFKLRAFQVELLFSIMIREGLSLKQRFKLGSALTQLLSSSKADPLKAQLVDPTLKAISQKSSTMFGGLLAMQCIICSVTKGEDLQNLFKKSIDVIRTVGENLLAIILQDLSALNSVSSLAPEQRDTAVNLVLTNIEGLRVVGETIKTFAVKITEANGGNLSVMAKEKNLLKLLFKTLCLYINNELQIKDCAISTCGSPKLDDIINETKLKVIKTINLLSKYVFDALQTGDKSNNSFLELIAKILPIMVSTMLKFVKAENIDISKQLDNPSIECIVTEILSFLTIMCMQREFFHLFAEIKKMLVIEIIFPFMWTIEPEKRLIQESAEEFVNLAEDCCNRQESGTFKTQAAQFMIRLCDHIDGTLTFVAVMASTLLEYSLISDKPDEIPQNYGLLLEFKDSIIISKTTAESRVEACLLILSVLSYSLPKRSDLIMILEQNIITYKNFFRETNAILIKSRYCLLLSRLIESIFKDPTHQEVYSQQISYLVECVALQSPQYDIVAIQACNGLKCLYENKEVINRVSPFIGAIVDKLSTFVDFVPHFTFFEIFQAILKTFAPKIAEASELIVIVVKRLTITILEEIKKEKKAQRNITMNNCWNTIRSICEQKSYIIYREAIEKELIPLFDFMEKPDDIDFDDEVVSIMKSFIQFSNVVSPVQWVLFKTFPAVFEKCGNILTTIFPALNLIIIHGRETIATDPTVIDMLIKMGREAIFCKDLATNEANYIEGALLMHLVMQYFGDNLTDTQLENIIMTAYDRLLQGAKLSYLKSTLFSIFLHGFIIKYQQTENLLATRQIIGPVFESILNSLNCFVTHYDRKVFVIGLSSIFVQSNMSNFVASKLTTIFDCIVTMLRIEQAIEDVERQRQKKQIKSQQQPQKKDEPEEEIPSNEEIIDQYLKDFKKANENTVLLGMISQKNSENKGENADLGDDDDDFSSEEEDEDEDYLPSEDEEARGLIESLITYFKKKDEFEYFRNIVQKIKEANFQGLMSIVGCLSEAKQGYLKTVLQSHRIPLDSDGIETVPRKIVSVRAKKSGQDLQAINLPANN